MNLLDVFGWAVAQVGAGFCLTGAMYAMFAFVGEFLTAIEGGK